jgi:DHA1 family bicyclomycin/chloramphenicol resistance-like MFS transporter
MSKLLVLLGSISILTPFSLDLYLPALPSIAIDLHASAGSVQATLPVFFVGLAVSQRFFGSIADHLGRRPPLLTRARSTGRRSAYSMVAVHAP